MQTSFWTCWRPLLLGLLGFGLLALLPHCAAVGFQGGAKSLEADALTRARTALADAGQGWASVGIAPNGVLQILGEPPNGDAAQAALTAARTALADRTGFPGVFAGVALAGAGGGALIAAADTAKAAPTPAAAPQKVEPAKVEPPKAEPPKVDAPKVDPPKVDPPPAAPAQPASADLGPLPKVDVGRGGPRACQTALSAALRTNPIRFASGSAVVAGVGRQNFVRLAAVTIACDQHRLQIAGHTDARGAAGFNQRLSEARAQAVADLLIAAGADRAALSVRGFGETRPLDRRTRPSAYAVNRRIEMTVIPR